MRRFAELRDLPRGLPTLTVARARVRHSLNPMQRNAS
jgi:hypothetical protein